MKYDPNRKFEVSSEFRTEDDFNNLVNRINEMSEDQLKWLVLGMFGIVNPMAETILPFVAPVNEEVLHATKAVIRLVYFGPSIGILDAVADSNYESAKPQINAKNN